MRWEVNISLYRVTQKFNWDGDRSSEPYVCFVWARDEINARKVVAKELRNAEWDNPNNSTVSIVELPMIPTGQSGKMIFIGEETNKEDLIASYPRG